jgi:hypothetical protein
MSSDTIVVNFTLGYMVGVQNMLSSNLLVYPSPTNEKLNIQLPENIGKTAQIEIFDLTGKVFISKTLSITGINSISVDCESLTKGFYIVVLQSDNLVLSKKILKD